MLEALIRAAPGFLAAEALLAQVWDEPSDPLAVTVGRLRRKLGDPPIIVTQAGIGYRIQA